MQPKCDHSIHKVFFFNGVLASALEDDAWFLPEETGDGFTPKQVQGLPRRDLLSTLL